MHGLKNVRVVDASVPPIALSTHLMASTYGVAEIGAAVVREYWNEGDQGGQVAFSGSSSLTGSGNASQSSSAKGSHSSGSKESSASGKVRYSLSWGVVVGLMSVGLQGLI